MIVTHYDSLLAARESYCSAPGKHDISCNSAVNIFDAIAKIFVFFSLLPLLLSYAVALTNWLSIVLLI